MKKVLVLLILFSVLTVGLFAEQADYFTFTMGSGAGYDINGDDVVASTVFGMDYTFNSTFTGGFKFFDIGGISGRFINISVIPADKLRLTVYTGTTGPVPATAAFGVGLSYDLFSKKDALFSNMSINIDWLADASGSYDVANGGVILFGLRTQVGL